MEKKDTKKKDTKKPTQKRLRWDYDSIYAAALKLLHKVHKKKRYSHYSNEIHDIVRRVHEWLPEHVALVISGEYSPDCLTRIVLGNGGTADVLKPEDRIIQNMILQELKPLNRYIINSHVYHLLGPSAGVRLATEKVREALATGEYEYVIRADVKSYYSSICIRILIEIIEESYDDPKVRKMLTAIATNRVLIVGGSTAGDYGIPIQGPLSQLFSALYLKLLDDAFDSWDVAGGCIGETNVELKSAKI